MNGEIKENEELKIEKEENDKKIREQIKEFDKQIKEISNRTKDEIKDLKNSRNKNKKEIRQIISSKKVELRQKKKELEQEKEKLTKNISDYHNHLEMKQLLGRTFLLLLIALVIYALVFIFFGDYLKAAGEWFGSRFGLWGVFIYVFIVDAIIVPTTPDVVFAIALEWEPISLLIVMSVASILGGFVGYLIGNKLNKLKFVKDLTASYREKGEWIIKKYGIWAIVIAALTPIPYTTISWIAGMVNLKKSHYLLASLTRIPRFIIYYILIKAGISGINIFLGS